MKKLILVVLISLCFGVAQAKVEYRSFDDSLTSSTTDVTRHEINMRGYTGFAFWFRLTQADTVKSDSITLTLQSYSTLGNVNDVLPFPEQATVDTTTVYYFVPLDSMMVYPFENAIRLKIAHTDTNTTDDADSDLVVPDGDGTPEGWHHSTGTTDFECVDDGAVDADSSDYVSILGPNDGNDSLEVLELADRSVNEAVYDSVVLHFQAEWVTDTGAICWGICVGDTDNCVWAQTDTSEGTVLTDGALQTYTLMMTTVPGYGTAWTPVMFDSSLAIFHPTRVDGTVRIYSVWATAHYDIGRLSPSVIYEVKYKLVE